MKVENRLPYLKLPDSDDPSEFVVEKNVLVDTYSKKTFPIINGMIDFSGIRTGGDQHLHASKGVFFNLNTFFSRSLDGKILTSVFAWGGIGFARGKKKIKTWVRRTATDKILFLEPEDKHLLSCIGKENCVTVEDLSSKNVMPAPDDYADINASMTRIPIRSNSFQNIISYFVVEHVKDPREHMKELSRILKPGGYLILGGPGDVYPSHRVPFNYFNVIRFGYYEMMKENNLELIEEYYPAKSWVSILYLCYTTVVRNSYYNTNQLTKLLQSLVLIISMAISPILNMIALLLDTITPFDNRIYSLYLALARKKED